LKFSIVNKNTKDTLRQFIRKKKLKVHGSHTEKDYSSNKITYIIHEDGCPGFTYQINDWDGGIQLCFLNNEDWEIVIK